MGLDPASWALIGAAIIGAGATAYSTSEQKRMAAKARDAQEEQRKVEQAMQNQQAARDRRAQIREARIQRAMVENTAAATGQGGSSATIVGGQTATQQAGINVGNINTAQSFSKVQSNAAQNVANADNATPSVGAQIAGSVGGTLLSTSLKLGTQSIFKKYGGSVE